MTTTKNSTFSTFAHCIQFTITIYTQYIHNLHTKYIYLIYTMYTQYIYNIYTKNIFNIYTIYTKNINNIYIMHRLTHNDRQIQEQISTYLQKRRSLKFLVLHILFVSLFILPKIKDSL